MSQFGSVPPESQFDPSQDIPFDQEYALAPDQSAMLDAGSYNFDPSAPDQPEEQAPMAFPEVRGGGMPSYSPQEMLQLSQTSVPNTSRNLPGLPSDEELDEMRPSESQMVFRSSDVEIKDYEANKGGESGDSAIDVLWKQLSGQEEQQIQKDASNFSYELQMTPEQLSPKRTQGQLEEGTRQEQQMQGVNEWRYMFNPVITMNKGFDTVLEKKHVARQIARGDYSDPSVRQHFLSQEYGVPPGFGEKAFERAAIGALQVAMIPEFLLKTMPATVVDKVFGGTASSKMVLEEAAAYARYSQNLQENKLTSDSFAGGLVLDLIETAPQIVAQYAAALGTGGTSTVASVAVFAAMGAGQSATSQYFESLNTNIEAGVPLRDASMRAFRDAAIAGVITGATEAVVGKIVGVGGLSGKTVSSVRKALGETTLKTYVKGAAFGIIPEGTQETADQFGSEFLINLIRSGEPEFKEFYDANPDWVMQTVKNSLYAGLVGGIIGAPTGVVTRFQNKRQAQGLVSTLDQIKGALPENDPRIRMLNRESMTSDEMLEVVKWMGDQEKKLGIRSAKDIQAEKAIGAGLDMDGFADEQLSGIIIAGNDGTTTARLRGAPNEKVGKYGNVDFVITPAMAADELTRRGVMQGATPAGARTSLVANEGAINPNTAVEERVYESGDASDDLDLMGDTLGAASNYVSTGASAGTAYDFVRDNPRLAARLARMTEPISRKMMEQLAGRSFAGNSFMFRQTFQEALLSEVEAQQQARDPRRIQEGVDNSRRQAREQAIQSLTGLSDAEISRVALGVNPRRARAISRILADAQRDATNVTAGPMTLAETERRAQTAEAAAAIRKNQTGSDIASIPALSQIASGDVARNRQAKLAKEKLDKVNANRKEVINSYTLFNTVTAVKTLLQDSLDDYRDAVINGTESQRLDAWLKCEAAWQVYNEARADPNIANDFNHAEITENFLVTRRFGQSKFGPTLQALSEQEKELNYQSSIQRAKPAFAKIKEDAQTEAVYQVERDEAASHEDPNWITTREAAVKSLTENADEQTLQDLADVIASDSAMGVEMRQRLESNLGIDELPAASEGADVAQAELRIKARIDAIRRTGDGVEIKYEGGFGKGNKFAAEKQAMADSLIADQAVLQESLAAAKLERQTIRRELDTFIEDAWKIPATKNKPAKRRKKRTEATPEEVALSRKLAKVEEQIADVEKQIDDISTQLGIEVVKSPNPKGVKQTATFATATTEDRAASISRAKQQVAELNDLNPADIEFRYDDGETKLTKRERALVEFGNNIGVTVVIMKTPEGSMTAGAYSKGVVYIDYRDVGRPSAWLSIAMHESMHHLAETNPEYFKDMYNLLVSKMPKAMKAIRAVYMQKFDLQAQRSAVRRAGLVVFNNESDKYQAGLLWLIRNDESQDFKTLRENLPDQLAAALDNEGLSGMVVPEREAVNEARAYFKRELNKADRAKMSSAEMRQEEVANLAEMLMDASFVGVIGKDGKVDMEAIRKLAKSGRATGLFAKLASAITDAMTAIPMLGKNRGLNETQARRLREFADNPKELSNPRTRQAAQVMIAKALVHMMDAKRGKIPMNGTAANPMSDAYAQDKIPALRQSIRNSNAVADELPEIDQHPLLGDKSPASVSAFKELQRSIAPRQERLAQAIRALNTFENPKNFGKLKKDVKEGYNGNGGITDSKVLVDKTGKSWYFKFSLKQGLAEQELKEFDEGSPSWREEIAQDPSYPDPKVRLDIIHQEFKNELFANLIAESLGVKTLKPTFATLNIDGRVYSGIATEMQDKLKVGQEARASVFKAITRLPAFMLLQITDMHPGNYRSTGDPIDLGGSLNTLAGGVSRSDIIDPTSGAIDTKDFIELTSIGSTPDLTWMTRKEGELLKIANDYQIGYAVDVVEAKRDLKAISRGLTLGGSHRFAKALRSFYDTVKINNVPVEKARLELADLLLGLAFQTSTASEVFGSLAYRERLELEKQGVFELKQPLPGQILTQHAQNSFAELFSRNREQAATGVDVVLQQLEKFETGGDIADAIEATQWGSDLKTDKDFSSPPEMLAEVLEAKTQALKNTFGLIANLYRNLDPNTAFEAFDEQSLFEQFDNSPPTVIDKRTQDLLDTQARIVAAIRVNNNADLNQALGIIQNELKQQAEDGSDSEGTTEGLLRVEESIARAAARLNDSEPFIGGTPEDTTRRKEMMDAANKALADLRNANEDVEAALDKPNLSQSIRQRNARSTVDVMQASDDQVARRNVGRLNETRPIGEVVANKVRSIGVALSRRTIDAGLALQPGDVSPASVKALASIVADEVEWQVKNGKEGDTGTGVGWYSVNWPAAITALGDVFPELATNEEARTVFSAIVAITSSGTKVRDNFNNAVEIYAQVRNGKKLSTVQVGNQRSEQMEEKLGQLEELIDQHGFAKLRSHLLQTTTVQDINARLRAAGQKTNNDYLKETIVPYSAIYFGPKLGMFYANLMGGDNYLTMDLWWSRSMNRMRGLLEPEPTESAITRFRELVGNDAPKNKYQLFDLADEYRNNYKNRVAPWRKGGYITRLEEALGRKEGATTKDKKSFERLAQKKLGARPRILDELKREHRAEKTANTIAKEAFDRLEEAPFNATDRKFMIDIANQAQANLAKRGIDLTISDIQAALWYYEKRLYGRLRGGGEQDVGYDEAAKEYIAANGNRSAGSSLLFNTGSVQRSGAKGAVEAAGRTVQRPAKKRTKDSLSQSIRNGEVNTGEPASLADADEIVMQALASPEALRNQAQVLSNAWLGTVRQLASRYVPRLISTDDEGIEVISKPADISPFWKFVAAPLNLAIGSKNADVISVVEDMIDMDVQRNLITQSRQSEAEAAWNMIPKAERDSLEFGQVMDAYHPPSTIDSNPLFASKSQQWRNALKWFKTREEVRRQEIVDTKRDAILSMLSRDNSARIVSRAAEFGQTWEQTRNERGRRMIRTDDGIISVPEAREKLAKLMMPDNWGRQYAHFFHWFGGEYKLAGYNSDGTRQIIGSANSEPEAYERLYAYKKANPGMYVRYTAEPAVSINPDEVVRMSDAQRRRLERMLADATGAYRDDVADAMRGIVGSKTSKRPFYAPLMERTGAKGFETDFMKVWNMSERLHNRWSMGGRMVKQLTPRIDAIRRNTPGWGEYLSDSIKHTLYTAPTSTEAMFDSMIRSIPVIGKIAGPFITRRLLGSLRALNYGRQLLTVRQQVVNSFQPLQTVYPILGEKGMMEAVAFYNSEEGKDVLRRHGQFDAAARFKEGSETVLGTDIMEFVSTMNTKIYSKTNENFNPSSESRNQNFAFVAMYWHGLQKGMNDAEAARYGRVYGNVYTQFYYTKANIPWLLRGPIASTSLQYRRFAINSTGLLINEFQKGNYSGAARYMAIMSMLGGINASIGFSVASLIRSAYMGDKEGADDLNYKLLQFFKSNLGSEKAANIAMMGLPAAIGLDLSGSISIWQKPFGRNIYEKIGATVSGPTINTMLQAMTNLTAETAVPMSITERGSRAILDSSPTAQQAIALWKAFSGDNSTYDARGRLMYKLDPYDQFMKSGAFRTVNETVWNMEYQRLRIIRNEVDSYADKAATLLAGGDTAGARTVLRNFNSLYPMASMTFKDIQTRVKNKQLSRTTPQLDRRVDVETGTIARKIAKKEGIGE